MTITPSTGPVIPRASRRYEGLADLPPLLAFASAATKARGSLFTSWHPGDIVWELKTSADRPQPNQFWEQAGRVAALAWFVDGADVWLETLPDAEHLTAEAVRWAEESLRSQGRERAVLRVRAFDSDAKRISALEAMGYSKGEPEGVSFRISLEGPLPAGAVVEGLTVRDSHGADPDERAAAHRAAWSHLEHLGIHGESQFTTDVYESLRRLPVYDAALDMLAVTAEGAFVGNCIAWTDLASAVGVFEPVGVAPAWRGKRVASLVMQEALRRLQARGLAEARVGTAHFNRAAIAAYLACGFEPADATHWWAKALP